MSWCRVVEHSFPQYDAAIEQGIAAYVAAVEQELGPPRASFRIKSDENANYQQLVGYYTYLILDISFVEFDSYMLMLVFGSNE